MFKKAVLVCSLLLMACGGKKPPTPAKMVGLPICDKVYSHILDIEVNHVFSVEELKDDNVGREARSHIDSFLQQRGTTKKFYTYCTTYMTESQATCALNTMTLGEINKCIN